MHRDDVVDCTVFDFKPPSGTQRENGSAAEDMEMRVASTGRSFSRGFFVFRSGGGDLT